MINISNWEDNVRQNIHFLPVFFIFLCLPRTLENKNTLMTDTNIQVLGGITAYSGDLKSGIVKHMGT